MAAKAPLTLTTDRLTLRQFEERDWEDLCVMFRDEECTRYTAGAPVPDWMTWRLLAGYLGHWQLRGFGPYAVVDKKSGKMMGPVGLWFPGDWPEPEIKFSLARAYWGKGFAKEAALAVKEMAARELRWKRVISLIHVENEASKKLARGLGAVAEQRIPFRGEEAEIYAYALPAIS